ncbi:MAG: ATP-binding protein [Dehalococcoidia bacterium]|nr:ATP-binding protein [Dehalococcoidia bacterium]
MKEPSVNVKRRKPQVGRSAAKARPAVHRDERVDPLIAQYAAAFESLRIGVAIYQLEDFDDPESLTLVALNGAGAETLKVEPREALGKRISETPLGIIGSERLDIYANVVREQKAAEIGDVYYFDEKVAQGVFNLNALPLPDNCVGILFTDVTEQWSAEAKRDEVLEQLEKERAYVGQLAAALKSERDILNVIMENTAAHLAYLDADFNFVRVNSTYASGSRYSVEELIGKNHFDLFPNAENEEIFRRVRDTGEPVQFIAKPFVFEDQPERGVTYWDWTLAPVKDSSGKVVGLVLSLVDVTERIRREQEMDRAFVELQRRQAEVAALLEASRAVLRYSTFEEAAGAIFEQCRQLIGATAGYIALVTPDGKENEISYLEPGGLACTVDPDAPMPIRGMREEALKRAEAYYENDFSATPFAPLLPEGHASLENVLFAPLVIEGKPVGLLGLANKEGGFTDDDARMASAFGELAAIALQNSRSLHALALSEERHRLLTEHARDAIYRLRLGDTPAYEYMSPGITGITGYTPDEYYTNPNLDFEIVYPEDRAVLEALRSSPGSFGGPTILRFNRKDGVLVWTEHHNTGVFDETGQLIALEGIARDITERIRSMEDLERMRNEFLAMVTHELKTPLAAIKGSAATALSSRISLDPSEVQDLFQIINEQADRLRDLADNLLDMTRIEAGSLSINPEPTDLRTVLNEARTIFVRSGRSQDISIDVPPALPLVRADRRRIVQVLTNILNNAAKFSPLTSTITMRVERDSDHVTIHITDQGRGIPEEKLSQLFKKFSQLHETSATHSGTGLGLAICKGIVEAHGGRIWADSPGEGKGATFSFTLPITIEAEAAPAAARGTAVRRGDRTRILAVDDELQVLRYLQHALEGAGYQPLVTGDSSQVVKLVEMEEPDLVLLDLRLPGLSGFDLLQRIREFSAVPVIFLTASDSDEDTVAALKMGADDYVTKPFSPSELLARIEAALRRRAISEAVETRGPFVLNDLEVNFAERRVRLKGKDISLSATEYKLLYELATHAGQILTYDQILQRVWGAEYSGETELVRSFVRNLRHKLGDDAKNPRYILTERQIGYRMAKN